MADEAFYNAVRSYYEVRVGENSTKNKNEKITNNDTWLVNKSQQIDQ